MAAWKALSTAQREFYRHIDPPRVGFRVFMGRALTALGRGEAIEVPVRMAWTPEEGSDLEKVLLVVRRHGALLFSLPLRGRVEIALTPSDVPYTVHLARGPQTDLVWAVDGLRPSDILPILASTKLGLRLVPESPFPGVSG